MGKIKRKEIKIKFTTWLNNFFEEKDIDINLRNPLNTTTEYSHNFTLPNRQQ